MLTALLLVASMGLGPAPAVVHPSPAPVHAVAASPASPPVQAADFATWLGAEPAAAPSAAGFDPAGAKCLTSCSQCPPSAPFCCPLLSGCVSCTTHPTPCTQ